MEVYEFEKSLLTRLEESCNVLQCTSSQVPASGVREEWACHVEMKIEPAGWQAIWKINRATCEQLKINYPIVVYGMVNNVFFQDLKADFSVIAVQDDDIHLPERYEVPLEDLFVTVEQENDELNIDRTADCLDELRFFYQNVWMPWDNDTDDDESVDWCNKYLETRIRFCFDLKRDMSRPMADHIRKLLTEARYIQSKHELIEMEMSDDETLEDDPRKVQDLLSTKLRMVQIRNEIEMLQNPMLRKAYETIHFKADTAGAENGKKISSKPSVFVITKKCSINEQIEFMEEAKKHVSSHEPVNLLPSLQDCFSVSAPNDHIYIPVDHHSIKLSEPLDSNGLLKAIGSSAGMLDDSMRGTDATPANGQAIITSDENDTVLMTFNGDYTIENVCFDCRNVRLGIRCRRGTVTLKNCRLIDNSKSSTNNGISIADGGKVILENSSIENFADGITCATGSALVLNNTEITGCENGVKVEDGARIEIQSSTIANCSAYGIFYKTDAISDGNKKRHFDSVAELKNVLSSTKGAVTFEGCCTFKNNTKSNIVLLDKSKMAPLHYSSFLDAEGDELVSSTVIIENAGVL